VPPRRRVRGDHELTRNICDAHSTAALLVGFLAYPTAVSAIFRLLRPCDHYKGGSRRVADDYQTRCGTPAHDAAKAYAWLMVFIIVIGFPLVCALLLYLNQRAIDPPARSEAEGVVAVDAPTSAGSLVVGAVEFERVLQPTKIGIAISQAHLRTHYACTIVC